MLAGRDDGVGLLGDVFDKLKEKNHEITKHYVFDCDVLCLDGCVIGPAGEDRLRSQRKFWAI
jgi:hypothetical protein